MLLLVYYSTIIFNVSYYTYKLYVELNGTFFFQIIFIDDKCFIIFFTAYLNTLLNGCSLQIYIYLLHTLHKINFKVMNSIKIWN